ncbi:MAG: hypothetical protein R3C56_35520 [Pirellulaceae bacterium]
MQARKGNGAIHSFWEAMGGFIIRRHWYVNAVCIALLIGLGFGLFRIKTSVQLLKLFDGNSQIIRDYAWLEEHFGRLVPMELVVRFLNRCSVLTKRMNRSRQMISSTRTQLSLLLPRRSRVSVGDAG